MSWDWSGCGQSDNLRRCTANSRLWTISSKAGLPPTSLDVKSLENFEAYDIGPRRGKSAIDRVNTDAIKGDAKCAWREVGDMDLRNHIRPSQKSMLRLRCIPGG